MEILKAEHAQQLSAEIQELKAALENEKDTSVAAAKSESEARVKDLEAEAAEWTVEREQLQAQVAEAIRLKDEISGKLNVLEGEENKTLKGKSASKSEPVDSGDMSHVTQEIERVNGALEVLALKAGNPATSLAEGMRANREQIELADYLKGLRFALGEGQE